MTISYFGFEKFVGRYWEVANSGQVPDLGGYSAGKDIILLNSTFIFIACQRQKWKEFCQIEADFELDQYWRSQDLGWFI